MQQRQAAVLGIIVPSVSEPQLERQPACLALLNASLAEGRCGTIERLPTVAAARPL